MAHFLPATKDNANGTLSAPITASSLSIPLTAGQGANFPQPYNGTATSGGTATTLNCTGISATIGGSAQAGKIIRNFTDGSWARIGTVNTNSLTTSALQGGSTNLWNNADQWRLDEFILTLEKHDSATPYNITAREEILIYGRSTDTLSVYQVSDRGYNGSVAQSFAASDFAYVHVTAPVTEQIKDLASELVRLTDTNITNIGNLQTGSYWYVVATGSANAYVAATPALTALAAGNLVVLKANFTNSGSATLNLNGLGAKTIKKLDGATNLVSGDIQNGQIVVLIYDGTNFLMESPVGTTPASLDYVKVVYLSGASSSANTNPTSDTAFDTHTYTIPANDLVSGVGYDFECNVIQTWGAGTLSLSVMLGSTVIASAGLATVASDSTGGVLRGTLFGTASAGASVSVRGVIFGMLHDGSGALYDSRTGSASVATNGTLALQFGAKFSSSNGSNSATMTMACMKRLATTAS